MNRCLIAICVLVISCASLTNATILRVPSEYPTIYAASLVEVAEDTILVAPGYYDEGQNQIRISPGASLISEGGRDVTTIATGGGDPVHRYSILLGTFVLCWLHT